MTTASIRVAAALLLAGVASLPCVARAACPYDCDKDNWTMPGAPGVPPDCDDHDSGVNPDESEIVGDQVDQDCDGRDGLTRRMLASTFGIPWSVSGHVVKTSDTVTVGDGGAWGGTVTRTPSLSVPRGPIHVAMDVDAHSGPNCTVKVTTQAPPPRGTMTYYWYPLGTGTLVSGKLPVSTATRVVTEVAIFCPPGSTMTVDWLTIQNGLDILPPATDFEVTWEDIDAPGAGLTTAIIRTADPDVLYGGSDVGGVAIKDGTTEWRSINGTAPDALTSQTALGVADILYTSWGELFALTGRIYASDLAGGLYSSDATGEFWTELANTIDDDVGGYAKYASCDLAGHGGGRLLLEGGVETVYIANGDPDVFGVTVWDGVSAPCELPVSGVTLPNDGVVGALASGYSYPNQIPWLLIGYRGRVGDEALYLCEMPLDGSDLDADTVTAEDGLTCTTGTAVCQELTDAQGFDVRDLEVDPLDKSIAYLADGGDDPDLTDCEGAEGGIYRIEVNDAAGNLSATVSSDLTAGAFAWTADGANLDLTGLAMDPEGEVLLAFMPVTHDKGYGYPRMYRIDASLLGSVPSASDWHGIEDAAADGATRQQHIDGTLGGSLSGGWLEAETTVKATPFPEYHALGNAYDGVFYGTDSVENDDFPIVVATEFQMWTVTGTDDLTPGWDPEDDTDWTFWPEPTTTHGAAWQTSVVNDIAQDADGNVWASVADLGLFELPPGAPAAEVDCLWDFLNAGGTKVVVADNNADTGWSSSVWALFYQQADGLIPQEIGLFRTLDGGGTWDYVAAGIPNTNARWTADDNQPWCKDGDTGHIAEPMGGSSGFAFNDDVSDDSHESWGNPLALDAIDENVALVGFNSYSYDHGATEVAGRVAYTIDGGANWSTIPFDGDWANTPTDATDDCEPYDFFAKIKRVSFVGKGGISWATEIDGTPGLTSTTEGGLDFFVGSRNPATTGSNDGHCALARVSVNSAGTTWKWFDLSDSTLACDVDEENMRGVVSSPWSKEVFVWGFYEYDSGVHQGGVCAIDIDNPTSVTRVVDPAVYQVAIADVAPHPEVTDLLVMAPLIDADAWLQCMETGAGSCPDQPLPMFAERSGPGWAVTVLGNAPPMTTTTAAAWSGLADPWVLYGTEGGGAWRGELSW